MLMPSNTVCTSDLAVQVQVSVPSICVQSAGLQSDSGLLDANIETRSLVVSASRGSEPYTGDPQAPSSQHPSASADEEQIYTVTIQSGKLTQSWPPNITISLVACIQQHTYL